MTVIISPILHPISIIRSVCLLLCRRERLVLDWFGSGTPTYLIKMLNKFGVEPSEIGPLAAKSSAFDAPTETMTTIIPLLYQSGYITIKGI